VIEVAIIASAWALFWIILGVINSLIIHNYQLIKKNARESKK